MTWGALMSGACTPPLNVALQSGPQVTITWQTVRDSGCI